MLLMKDALLVRFFFSFASCHLTVVYPLLPYIRICIITAQLALVFTLLIVIVHRC
jgi:hypothetical protein